MREDTTLRARTPTTLSMYLGGWDGDEMEGGWADGDEDGDEQPAGKVENSRVRWRDWMVMRSCA
jgi:hypothetical protein